MGARINYVFNDGTEHAVALYSHWGETDWQQDIARAVYMAKPRWGDTSYATRIIVSQLINDSWNSETGFGLFAINPTNPYLGDFTVVIDMVNNQIDGHSFDEFCAYHLGAENLDKIGFRVPISS